MNESTNKQFQEILESIERLKDAGYSDGVARFGALTKLLALVLARLDYQEEMIEWLVKQNDGEIKKEESQ